MISVNIKCVKKIKNGNMFTLTLYIYKDDLEISQTIKPTYLIIKLRNILVRLINDDVNSGDFD